MWRCINLKQAKRTVVHIRVLFQSWLLAHHRQIPGEVAVIKLLARKKKMKSAHEGAPVEEVLSGVAMPGAPSEMSEPLHRSAHHLAVHRSAKAAPLSAVRSEILSR